jgi:FkbM family methyltransferase
MESYSNLMNLGPFFEGMDDYVALKLPEHFPNYYEHSDIDVLCGSRLKFLRHILRLGKEYQDRGFKIQMRVENSHGHVDFFAPGETHLNFRFDLIESLVDFREFAISPAFERGVLDRRREIAQNGARVLVPRLVDDLTVRCLEYLKWRDVRPEKIKHWEYIERAKHWDFIEVINRHTNLNVSVKRRWGRFKLKASWKPRVMKLTETTKESPFYKSFPTCQIPHLGELYQECFGKTRNGCFVEVGALDGECGSNTSCLADLGWKGFYIEPVPANFEKCKSRHEGNKNTTVSQVIIGAEAGATETHIEGPLSTLSSEMRDHFRPLEWASDSFNSENKVPVRQMTFNDYLAQNNLAPNFELLGIDVEGFEWDVLRNFDIEKWRPQMVIIELHDQNDDYTPIREKCLKIVRYFEEHDYTPVFRDYTNTVYVCNRKFSGSRSRLDYFLIWGHGIPHTNEIVDMIRREKDFRILAIHKKHVADIGKFVSQLYSCDVVPIEHLMAKTRYLLQTKPEIILVLAENQEPQERFNGEGAFRHIQCQRVKEIKEGIRNRFNPREDGKRTEDHVIHASDFESQTEHMLEILSLPPVSFYRRRPNRELDVPYHLQPFENYTLQEVPIDSLYASILGQGVVPISQTPHYRYLLGEKECYEEYHAAHFGRELSDDHLPESFDRLAAKFDNNWRPEDGRKSFILAKKRSTQGYQILDGVHRAAILKLQNVKRVLIAEPVYGDSHRFSRQGSSEPLEAADALLWESTVADTERPTYEVWTRQLRAPLEGAIPPTQVNTLSQDISTSIAANQWLAKKLGKGIGRKLRRLFGRT